MKGAQNPSTHRIEQMEKEFEKTIAELFSEAKKTDEFEFICTLLRVRGIVGPGQDALNESLNFSAQLLGLVEAPIESSLRRRLVLLLYCHLTEVNDVYNVLSNLGRIAIRNDRYSMDPLDGCIYPLEKVDRINKLVSESAFASIGEALDYLLLSPVRNAFYHSEYAITQKSFNLLNGRTVQVGATHTSAIPWDWLDERLQDGINLPRFVMACLMDHLGRYTESRIIQGRMGSDGGLVDIELFVDTEAGIIGLRSTEE